MLRLSLLKPFKGIGEAVEIILELSTRCKLSASGSSRFIPVKEPRYSLDRPQRWSGSFAEGKNILPLL
jgi:hypothetical protein